MPQLLHRNIAMGVVLVALCLFPMVTLLHAQSQRATYTETRRLLSKMERDHANGALKKLFETGDVRMPDLIAALDDERRISVNSQVIIKYLADPQGLHLLDEWRRKQEQSGREYAMPKMELLHEPKYLSGNDSDLAKLAMRNKNLFEAARFNSGDVSMKVVGYNKTLKVALLEVIQGEVFTAGWHSVIKFENNRWRLISDNNVWVS